MEGVEEYIKSMEQVKHRIYYIELLFFEKNNIKNLFILESIALQFRKVLELIAFSSISPNLAEYKKIRQDFR